MLLKVREIRWENLKRLESRYPTQTAFARAAKMDSALLWRYLRPCGDNGIEPEKWLGERGARRLETALGLEENWLDVRHGDDSPSPAPTPALVQSLDGLSNLQKAVIDAVVRLSRGGKLSDSACIELLHQWKQDLE